MIAASDYLELMKPFLAKLPDFLRQAGPDLQYYGTGESAHWPTQSNCNVFAALAVLSQEKPELRETALSLLRYALRTHVTGDVPASDGKQWGCHWISVLGLERMAHGVNAIREHLTCDDKCRIKKMMLTESEWLLKEYPVEQNVLGTSGKNKPESNIWNGGILLRTALEYPDEPLAPEFRKKAVEFFLAGLSHPSDGGEAYNFTENWSLDHHAYLNVGYMVICLSNIAMLHFYCKERGFEPPPELYHHVADLWALVKKCTFPDGRLLRIGGDTRARYTYCQNYAIPAWLFAADYLGDATAFEEGWLDIVRTEVAYNGDGSYYGKRLAQLRSMNYYYYARLESDAFLCLSYGVYWRKKFDIPAGTPGENTDFAWHDQLHGATFLREKGVVRSFVWHGAQGPTGLCLPESRSDLAEWQGNLRGRFATACTAESNHGRHSYTMFPGGFLSRGVSEWREINPLGENEGVYAFARHQTAVAALPDGHTMLILEYADIIKEAAVTEIKGICLQVPNDLFNGEKRTYSQSSDRVGVDGLVTFCRVYGGELQIRRPAERNIVIHRKHGPFMYSLFADEICCSYETPADRLRPGYVALDNGAAITVGEAEEFRQFSQPGLFRAVQYGSYIFVVNFGEGGAPILPEKAMLIAGAPDTCALYRK